jgi:hypothetical protein
MSDPTFLFTDIEGSTTLWERFPERMRAALARHDSILRGIIGAQGAMDLSSVPYLTAATDALESLSQAGVTTGVGG